MTVAEQVFAGVKTESQCWRSWQKNFLTNYESNVIIRSWAISNGTINTKHENYSQKKTLRLKNNDKYSEDIA